MCGYIYIYTHIYKYKYINIYVYIAALSLGHTESAFVLVTVVFAAETTQINMATQYCCAECFRSERVVSMV